MKIHCTVLLKYTVSLWVVWCSLVFALPPKKVFVTTGAVEQGVPSGATKPLFSIGLGPFSLQLGVQPSWGHLPSGQIAQAGQTVQKNITLPSLTILVPNAVLNVSGLQQPGVQPAQPPVMWVVVPNGGAPMPMPPAPMPPAPMPMPPNGGTVVVPGVVVQPEPVPMPSPFPWETTTTMLIPPAMSGGQQSGDQGGFIVTETIDSMGNVVQTITPVGSLTVDGQSGETFLVPGTPQIVEEVIEVKPGQPNQPGTAGPIRRGVVTRLTGVVLQRNTTKPIINFIKGN